RSVQVFTIARALHAPILESAAALQRGRNIAGNKQNSGTIRHGRDGGWQNVAGPRTANAHTGTELTTDARIAVGHEAGPFLMSSHNRLQSDSLAQPCDKRVDMATRH